ncbi:MAG: hypothetical protein IV097_22380 [Burkholderiaceae bacterium]|nr:hypothetical protein [Burkholderiaceae bacterium]
MKLRALALSLSDDLAELVKALAQLATAQSRAFEARKQYGPRKPRRSLRAESKRVKS